MYMLLCMHKYFFQHGSYAKDDINIKYSLCDVDDSIPPLPPPLAPPVAKDDVNVKYSSYDMNDTCPLPSPLGASCHTQCYTKC